MPSSGVRSGKAVSLYLSTTRGIFSSYHPTTLALSSVVDVGGQGGRMSKELLVILLALFFVFSLGVVELPEGDAMTTIEPPTTDVGPHIEPGG